MPILLVDDCRPVLEVVRTILEHIGFSQIDEAADGLEALERFKARKYGLVISDWNMRPMNGYELLRQIRANVFLSTTPFIMMTTAEQASRLTNAKQAGLNHLIVKPFTPSVLRQRIESICGEMRMQGVI